MVFHQDKLYFTDRNWDSTNKNWRLSNEKLYWTIRKWNLNMEVSWVIGVPLVINSYHPFLLGSSPTKTNHFWGTPMTMETPISSTKLSQTRRCNGDSRSPGLAPVEMPQFKEFPWGVPARKMGVTRGTSISGNLHLIDWGLCRHYPQWESLSTTRCNQHQTDILLINSWTIRMALNTKEWHN